MSTYMGWNPAQISYCGNVHPANHLADLCASIEHFFQGVRQQRDLNTQDSGLWISAQSATELQERSARAHFLHLLQRTGVRLTSLNGFPYGSFHKTAVKAEVYSPDWSDPRRLEYSLQLARILAEALPQDCTQGVISTVPLGYAAYWTEERQQQAETLLRQLTQSLAELHQKTGKKIVFCLEMEPDCVLENTTQSIAFFQHWQALDPHHEYLALCFDVCHQAVVFEHCYQSLERLRQAQVPIGKIQLSNALICRLPDRALAQEQVLQTLERFAEPVYLHQVRAQATQEQQLAWLDLPDALCSSNEILLSCAELRIHFHIPLFSEQLLVPELSSSQEALFHTFDYLADHPEFRPVLEVETYSWNVLPPQVRPDSDRALIKGIAAELHWVEEQLLQRGLLRPCESRLEV